MRTIVAGSVCRRLAMARTLRSTYSRGCSRIGRMISCRLILSWSILCGSWVVIDCAVIFLPFITREDCPIWAACQPGALAMASSEEVGAAFFVFLDPGFRKAAVADFRENLAHFLASLFRDDAWPSGVVALLGRVADGIAHVTEAATVDQIHDELEFVEAFEIGDLRLVAGFRERFESRFD